MTGIPGTVGRPGWTKPPKVTKPGHDAQNVTLGERSALVLKTAPFLALAIFAAAHWVALVEPAPTRRALVAALIATGGGVLIHETGRLPRLPGLALRIALVLLMLLFAVSAIGIRMKLLLPAGWHTLSDRVTGGLSVVGTVTEWPYAGPNTWLRLTTLIAAPLTLVAASALAFWPRKHKPGAIYRALPLAALVALYGVAVAARPFDHQALRGIGLLACLAAWLWLPRLSGRDGRAAALTVGIVCIAALMLTPKLASSEPWIDYRHWSWSLHHEGTITFNWQPGYGPLHWPRKGTTLLLIKSKQPHYWKAETLDHFDGSGWTASPPDNPDPTVSDLSVDSNTHWTQTARITVRGFKSNLVIAPGTLLATSGLPSQHIVASNATYLMGEPLKDGDTYSVTGYTPDPSMKQMRAAPPADAIFNRFTTLSLPQAGGQPTTTVRVPLVGAPQTGDANAAAQINHSIYARVYSLATDITSGAHTQYDLVRRVGAFLQGNYLYDERVPQHKYPLADFLLRGKRGYCQHFAGAAALMLRMLGVPTRVVSGFAPGTRDSKTHEFVVRDLDAHSWIEVWFQGIGWVPFDATPAQAPASSQATSFNPFSEIASAARGNTKDIPPKKREDLLSSPGGKGAASSGGDSGGTSFVWIALGLGFALLVGAAIVVALMRRRSRRRPLPAPCGDPDVDHLVRLLARLGLDVDPGTTLLELERRIERLGGPEAAGYAERLRRRRYGSSAEPGPARADRRKLRHALAAAVNAGPITRLQLVMPDNRVTRPSALKLSGGRRAR